MTELNFLFLEPFFGGSHRDVAQGLVSRSRHRMELLALPARFWKWRMRGAALHFIPKVPPLEAYDGLVVTDLMSLADFKALCGSVCPPTLLYFHESQFTYPLAPGESPDYHFGFTDITSALAADRVYFNSHTHRQAFFENMQKFIRMMPEFRPRWVADAIRDKAGVLYPGCDFSAVAPELRPQGGAHDPLIIWNHRWEFDKNPDAFFDALELLEARGIRFRLALMGENFQAVPKAFIRARRRWPERIVQYGFVPSRADYIRWLTRGTVVVSTAIQENFGISIIEAVRFGCLPLLPRRLVYPEIIPEAYHDQVFYRSPQALAAKLEHLLTSSPKALQAMRRTLSTHMERFSWDRRIGPFDDALGELVDLKR